MGTKKGAVSLSLLRKLKWSPGARTPSEHHHHRQVATAVGCCERFPRKDPGVFDLLGPPFSCDAPGLTRLLSKCTYGLPNISGFGGSAPERVRPAPSLGLKGSPQLLRCLLPEVASLHQQRWSARHRSASVDKDLRVSRPGGVVPVEPPRPVVVAVDQPTLSHSSYVP